MTIITRYAIRHNPTGGYLPVPTGRGGRGGSHEEPIVFPNDKRMVRMWPTTSGAKSCLAHWLKGKYYCYPSGDEFDGYDEDVEIKPQPHRCFDDMEIVPITITLP